MTQRVRSGERRRRGLGWLRRRRDGAAEAHDQRVDDEQHDETAVVDLDDDTFEAGTAGDWTVVDFWAAWCGPCRVFSPVFDDFARATSGIRFARVNVDSSPRTAQAWGIATIPTVSLFDPDGNEVERLVGVPSHQAFRRLLERSGATPDSASGGIR